MKVRLTAILAVALGFSPASRAIAQVDAPQPPNERTRGYFAKRVPAPAKALELLVGSGYTQGFGDLQEGVPLGEVVRAGVAFDLGVGYRVDAHWGVTAWWEYQELEAERATGARGLTASVATAYHVAPHARTDPWIQIGGGYRLLWETYPSPAPSVLTHGFELAKLTMGFDVRVSPGVAIAPVIGADLTLPLWQQGPDGTNVALRHPRVSTFLFGGLQGRFDIGSSGGPPS